MSDDTVAITVRILDKEFRVACPEEEREGLLASASLLNTRMQQIRDGGKVVGTDRIAVMAALNLTHELLQNKSQREALSHSVTDRIKLLQNRIEQALEQGQQMEL